MDNKEVNIGFNLQMTAIKTIKSHNMYQFIISKYK